MDLKFVEAGHPVDEHGIGGNWGKFAVGRWNSEEMREKTQFPGCEGQHITSLHGWGGHHIWLFDLQTGEGARFHTNNPIPVDAPHQLKNHQIWVCPLFEPFVVWLWSLIRGNPATWWDELPRTVELPDAPFDMQGYRRPGPNAEIFEKFDRVEHLLHELIDALPDHGGDHGGGHGGDDDEDDGSEAVNLDPPTSGGVPLTDELIERLAREAEGGYDLNRLDAARPRRPGDVQKARRLTYRSLDEEQV